MADDVAALGISVDSSQLAAGEKALRSYSGAAADTGNVVDLTSRIIGKAAADSQAASQRIVAGMSSVTNASKLMVQGMSAAGTAAAQSSQQIYAAGASHAYLSTQAQALSHSMRSAVQEIALGVSPVQILTQQLGHLSFAASGPGGITGAFMSIVGAVGPIGLALAAVGAAAAAMFLVFQSHGPTLEQTLAEQARLIKVVQDAFSGAANAAGEFLKQSEAITKLQLTQNLAQLGAQLESLTKQFMSAVTSMRPTAVPSEIALPPGVQGLEAQDIRQATSAFAELNRAIEQFNASARQAKDVQAFRDNIAAIGNAANDSNPALANAAAEMLKSTQSAGDAADAYLRAQAALAVLAGTATDAQRALLGLATAIDATNKVIGGLEQQAAAIEIAAKASAMGTVEAARFTAAETARQKIVREGGTIDEAASKKIDEYANRIGTATGVIEANREAKKQHNKEALSEVDILRNNVSALGNAATASEKYELQVAVLTQKFQEGTISADTYNRAIAAINPTTIAVQTTITDLGKALSDAFIRGKDAADALHSSLQAIAATASSKAISSIVGGLTTGTFDLGTIATQGIIGIGATLLSKIFGGTDKEAEATAKRQEEELQKAKEAWASMTDQVNEFNRAAAGIVKGDLRNAIGELTGQFNSLAAAAIKAQNFAAEAALRQTLNLGINRLLDDFISSLPRLNDQLRSEGGLAGATANAISAVQTFSDQVMGLKDSFDQAAEASGGFGFFAEQWSIIAQSAQQAGLALIGVNKPMSEMQQEINRVNATAAALQDVLVKLGMSAEEAAAAISEKLNKALDDLRTKFIDDLVRKVNELAGGSWINQGQDLFNEVQQLRADAAALGITTALIDNFYVLSAQKIVDQNKLVGAQFDALQRMLGLTGTSLHEFVDAVESTGDAIKRTTAEINAAIQDYQDQLFILQQNQDTLGGALAVFDLQAQRAREEEIAKGGQALAALEALQQAQRAKIIDDFNKKALEAQKQALEDQIKATEDAIKEQQRLIEEQQKMWEAAVKVIEDARRTIQNFIAGFLGGAQSFLSPQEQMNQAISTFNQQLTLAQSGDQNALQGITNAAQSALDAIKRYYGSTSAGATLQQQILGQLGGLPAQLSPEQFIVDAINSQTDTQSGEAAEQLAKLQEQLANLQLQLTQVTETAAATTGTNTVTGANLPAAKTALELANLQLDSINNAVVRLVMIDSRLAEANTYLAPMRQMIAWQNTWWGVTALTPLPTFARGGLVRGNDNVPILAHAGEMVMNRRAVGLWRGQLEAMNAGTVPGQIEQSIKEGFQRMIETFVSGTEMQTELLESMAGDFRTLAKAERRAR